MTNAMSRIKTRAKQKHPIVIDGRLDWGNAEKLSFLFLFGGVGYGLVELIWRGRTHPSMVITGGICFLLVYGIRHYGGRIFRRRRRQSHARAFGLGLFRQPFQRARTDLSALYISLVSLIHSADADIGPPFKEDRQFVNF